MPETATLDREYRRVRQWGMQARPAQEAVSFGIDFTFDGGGVPLLLPLYSPPYEVPTNCRIIGCRIFIGIVDALGGNTAFATFNIWRSTFTDYPSMTLLHDTVTVPTLSSAVKADVLNTTSWTTRHLLARDTLVCQVSAISGDVGIPQQITLSLLLRRTPPLRVGVVDLAGNRIVDNSGNVVLKGT